VTRVAEPEVLDLLTRLVEKSLVVYEEDDQGRGRYRLLETVRQYARDRLLESGQGGQFRDQHLEQFLALSEEAEPRLTGPEQAAWLARLEAEHDNLRAALDWSVERATLSVEGSGSQRLTLHAQRPTPNAQRSTLPAGTGLRLCGALRRFWEVRGHLSEGRQRCAAVLFHPVAQQRTAVRSKAMNGAGLLAWRQGDYQAAHYLFEQALAINRERGDRAQEARNLNNLGALAADQGDFEAARALYEQSLAIHEELGDRAWQSINLSNLGVTAFSRRNYKLAWTLYEQALAIIRELGDRAHEANTLNNMGDAEFEQGNYEAARRLYRQALAISWELGDRRIAAGGLEGLAAVAAVTGMPERAACFWGAGAALRDLIGSPLTPEQRKHVERRQVPCRAALGPEAFEAAWSEGREMSAEAAVELALAEVHHS
jgi:non-specific serine/threonine protein kinase